MRRYRLYKIGFFKLSSRKVAKWIEKRNVEGLNFTIKNGDFKLRYSALLGLYKIKCSNIEEVLQTSIQDPIRLVSLKACELLEEWDIEGKWKSQIDLKQNYWNVQKLKEKEQLSKRVGFSFSTLWQKADQYEMARITRFESVKSKMEP